jgi:hypothetical protein
VHFALCSGGLRPGDFLSGHPMPAVKRLIAILSLTKNAAHFRYLPESENIVYLSLA